MFETEKSNDFGKISSAIKINFATHLTTFQILVKNVEYRCGTGMQMFDVFPC